MTPGKLFSRFYIKNGSDEAFKEEKLVGELLITDGIVHETRFNCMGIHRIEATYRAPYSGGTDNWFLDKGMKNNYFCLMASALQSWLGEESIHLQEKLPSRILNGQFQENKLEDGKLCYIIQLNKPGVERIDHYYFDSTTYFLIRWDTFYTDLGPKPMLSRSRRYKNISTIPLPADTWELTPEHSDRPEKPQDREEQG